MSVSYSNHHDTEDALHRTTVDILTRDPLKIFSLMGGGVGAYLPSGYSVLQIIILYLKNTGSLSQYNPS